MASPSPFPNAIADLHQVLPHASVDIPTTCQRSDSLACTVVWHWTHNADLAHLAAWLIGKPFAILALLLLAWILRWIAGALIDRLVRRAGAGVLPRFGGLSTPAEGGAPHSNRRMQRAHSLGSLLKSVASVLIFGVTFVMVLAQLGVNIAPILASAGVLGVAIGFGAQSLVKDLFSGISMMLEDQYGVGDSIKIGDISGTVEAVNLRVTRLRDVDGTVWYIRNGEIVKLGNQSQNWARSVLDIPIGLRSDLTKVREVLTEVTHSLAEDPSYRDSVIGEPEVWGVQAITVDGMTVRVSIKTVPGQQWRISRELRERIKRAFDAADIDLLNLSGGAQ